MPVSSPTPATIPSAPSGNRAAQVEAMGPFPDAKSAAIAQLKAQVAKQNHNYQARPRKVVVGKSPISVKLAEYLNSVVQKIEYQGSLLHPVDHLGNKIQGELLLTIEISSDGALRNVRVDQSSANQLLDVAAIRAVNMASPFPALPEALKDSTGQPAFILSFSRQWKFISPTEAVSFKKNTVWTGQP